MDVSRLVAILITLELVALFWRFKIDLDMLSIHRFFMQDRINGYRLAKVFEGNKIAKQQIQTAFHLIDTGAEDKEVFRVMTEALRYLEIE